MTKKIIFLIGTLSNGGAERTISNLTLNLPDNIEKEIILFGHDAKIEYDYTGKLTYLDRDNPASIYSKIKTLIKRINKLKKIKRENEGVPIISFLEYPNLLNVLSGNNKNTIVSVRNFMSTKHSKGIKAFFWNLTIKKLYKKAREIIVVSEEMKNDLVKNYNLSEDKINVIYNSYPINDIEEKAQEKLSNNHKEIFKYPTIITAGRLTEQKGQIHLLNAFKNVKDKIPEAQLVLLGEGVLEERLREHALKLKIIKSVHFLGFQENPYKFIAKSKVFVMTSYYEGFPNALAEAMVCKIPIISTDCPSGPKEIIEPNEKNEDPFGFLVPAINHRNKIEVEKYISIQIIELIQNEEKHKYYSLKSYDRILDFDIRKIINKWLALI